MKRELGEGWHVWPGRVLNNCPPTTHISLIICRLRNQIISQSFAKSLAKQIVPPLQNVFVFGPAHRLSHFLSSPLPAFLLFVKNLRNYYKTQLARKQVQKGVRERGREIEISVTLPNKLFVHINWIGPQNFLF